MAPDSHRGAAHAIADPSLASQWDDLAVRSGAPPFCRPAWVEAWATAFGHEVEVLTAHRDGAVAAVLPVIVKRSSIATAADWHVPAIEAVAMDAPALDEVVGQFVAGRRRATADFIPSGSATAAAFIEAYGRFGYRLLARPRLRSPYVDFGEGWDRYADSLSTKKWRELRRRRRRLEEEGPVVFESLDGRNGLEGLLDEGFGVEGSGWKSDRGTAILSDPEAERFYRQVARWAADAGMLRLNFLRVAGRAVAFDLALVDSGVEWLLKTGFDPDWYRFSPGSLLRAEALRLACDSGVRRYDFAGAADSWKMEWTTTTREILVLDGFAPGMAGTLSMHASRVARRWRSMRNRGAR